MSEDDDNEIGCKCGCMCSCAAGATCSCTNGTRYDQMCERAERAEHKLVRAEKEVARLLLRLAAEHRKVRAAVRRAHD